MFAVGRLTIDGDIGTSGPDRVEIIGRRMSGSMSSVLQAEDGTADHLEELPAVAVGVHAQALVSHFYRLTA